MWGNRREKIMSDCPESFENELRDFIDEIEAEVKDIAEKLSVNSVNDLSNIAEAAEAAENLARDLY